MQSNTIPGGYVRLPLKNAYNARDLGGYPCRGGGVTRQRAFVRADGLAALDTADINFLIDYGVKTVIDLRSADEIAVEPEPEALVAGTEYINIPLIAGDAADATKISGVTDAAGFLPAFYKSVVQNGHAAVARVLKTAASATSGAVLFHCTAGKDRTGIIAALLLGIAGVAEADILANYEVTYTYIRQNPVIRRYAEASPDSREQLYSRREYLEGVLNYIHERGGFEAYFAQIGILQEDVLALRRRIIA
ncbi:MAG: tyrosine-protein phosphatase [Oscillospiraceae bacterium]|jgi:protein-tyrosine phosphatase|nr:tyrosine-protein phosphatase [Oscillospiraceae bacterium]